jgi:hypothetical protein
LRGTRRFFNLLKNENNNDVLKAELRLCEETNAEDQSKVPCPYLSQLIGLAWTVDLSVGYAHGADISGCTFDINSETGSTDGGMHVSCSSRVGAHEMY